MTTPQTPLTRRQGTAVINLDEACELSGHSLSRICRAIDGGWLAGWQRRRKGRTTVGDVRAWVLQGAPDAVPGLAISPDLLEALVEATHVQAQHQRATLGDHKGVAAATEATAAKGYEILRKARKGAAQ